MNVWLERLNVFLFCGCNKEPFLKTIEGNSNRQKTSGQHKLEASNSQDSMELFLSVSYGQKRVLWHLEEELGRLANCMLENDNPLENSKVWLKSKKKLVLLWTLQLLFHTEFQALPIKHGKFAFFPSNIILGMLLFLAHVLKCSWVNRWGEWLYQLY